MDNFGGLGVMLIAVFELIGIMWVYGVSRFCDNIEFMNKFKPSIVFKVCWVIRCARYARGKLVEN